MDAAEQLLAVAQGHCLLFVGYEYLLNLITRLALHFSECQVCLYTSIILNFSKWHPHRTQCDNWFGGRSKGSNISYCCWLWTKPIPNWRTLCQWKIFLIASHSSEISGEWNAKECIYTRGIWCQGVSSIYKRWSSFESCQWCFKVITSWATNQYECYALRLSVRFSLRNSRQLIPRSKDVKVFNWKLPASYWFFTFLGF